MSYKSSQMLQSLFIHMHSHSPRSTETPAILMALHDKAAVQSNPGLHTNSSQGTRITGGTYDSNNYGAGNTRGPKWWAYHTRGMYTTMWTSIIQVTHACKKCKGSEYSIVERRVPELILVLGSQPAGDVINAVVGCHYFPPGLQLRPQPLRGLLPILLLVEQRHDGCEQFA